MILANPLADPPCADINKFLPNKILGTNSLFHKGYNLFMTSLRLYEHDSYVLSI